MDDMKNGWATDDGGGTGLYKRDGDWRGYAESEIHLTWREMEITGASANTPGTYQYVGSFEVTNAQRIQVGTLAAGGAAHTVDTGYGTYLQIGGGFCTDPDECGDGTCKPSIIFACNAASAEAGATCVNAADVANACTGEGHACVLANSKCECKTFFAGELCKKSLYDFGEATETEDGDVTVNPFDEDRTRFNVMLCMGVLMIYSICHMAYLTLQSIDNDKINGFIQRLVSPVIIQQVLLYLTPIPTIIIGCLASLVTVTSIASFNVAGGYLQWRSVIIVLTLMSLSRSHSIRAKTSIGFKDEIFSIVASVVNLYYVHSLRVAASPDMIRLSSSIFAVFAAYEGIHIVTRVAHAMSAVGNMGVSEQFIGFIGSADVVDAFMGLTVVFTAFASFRRAANLYGGLDHEEGSPFTNLGLKDDKCAYVSADIGSEDDTSIGSSWSDLPECADSHCCGVGDGDGTGWLVHLPWVSFVLCAVALFIKSGATISSLQNLVKLNLRMPDADGLQSTSSWRLGKRAARYSRIRVDTSG